MKTVITPRLVYNGHRGLESICGTEYFCISGLNSFIDFPEDAKYYWVEASDKQFPERNGCAVYVRLDVDGECYYSRNVNDSELWYSLGKFLKKLGVGEKLKRIYFRLWYE